MVVPPTPDASRASISFQISHIARLLDSFTKAHSHYLHANNDWNIKRTITSAMTITRDRQLYGNETDRSALLLHGTRTRPTRKDVLTTITRALIAKIHRAALCAVHFPAIRT